MAKRVKPLLLILDPLFSRKEFGKREVYDNGLREYCLTKKLDDDFDGVVVHGADSGYMKIIEKSRSRKIPCFLHLTSDISFRVYSKRFKGDKLVRISSSYSVLFEQIKQHFE